MKVDPAGAPFYINHSTQQTQWEHPGTGNTPPGCATDRPAHTNRSGLNELSEGMDEAERDANEALECENSGRKGLAVDLYRGAAAKLRSLVDAYGAEMGAAQQLDLHARSARYVASADTVC